MKKAPALPRFLFTLFALIVVFNSMSSIPISAMAAPSEIEAAAIVPLSDDFDRANLDSSRWTFVNPLDDGWVAMTGQNTADAYLELSVPEGPTHDPWNAENRSVRVMQSAADTDFEIEVKFDSEPDPTKAYQLQGIIIEESDNNWLRFNLQSNGSNLLVFASSTVSGSSSAKINLTVSSGAATYLRVNRSGDTWTFSYSGDGSAWTVAGSFTHSMVVSSMGPFAANHGSGNNAPAYTAEVDYFFNTASPISPEDDGAEADTWVPFIHTIKNQAGGTSLTITWYTDELSIGAVDLGLNSSYGTTETETTSAYTHSVTFTGLTPGETYHYQIRSEDSLSQEATSGDYEFTFDPTGPTIDVWYGDTQDFGVLGNPQEFYINIMGNVSDSDGVASLSYTLDGGSPIALTIGSDGRRLENAGDFNIDPNWTTLSTGPHTIVITAEDAFGNTTNQTITVNYSGGNLWSFPYTADWSTLTTDGDPNTPDPEIQTLAQVVDGNWSVDSGWIRTVEPGYDRLVALGDHLSDDYEVLVPLIMHTTPGGFGAGLLFRWNGHTDTPVSCSQPKCGYLPLGAIGWFRSGSIEFYNTGVSESFSITTGTTYWMRMRVENSGSNPAYYLKVWEDGETEPVDWNLTHTEEVSTPQTGSILLITHQADVSFGTVEITNIPGAPNVAPTAVDDNATVLTGESGIISVLNNDSDSDGSLAPGTVTIDTPPTNGSIESINPTTGAITYLHDGSATTSDSFTYTVDDNDGVVSNAATVNLTISDTLPLSFISDDFCSGTLDPAWTFVDPLSDGSYEITGAGTSNAWMEISVPGGTEHQVWTSGIQAPHIIQAATDTDFELEVKFESPVDAPRYEEQGVLIKQDDSNFLRFEVYSNTDNTYGIAASLLGGTIFHNVSIEPLNTSPIYMRVKRVGNEWTHSYSTDGTNFTNIGIPFTQVLTVTGVGIYGGNGAGGSSPAHTAQFDYFENLASPITDEDGCGTTYTVTYDGNGNTGGTAPVDTNDYLPGDTVTVLGNTGSLVKTGYTFVGWNTADDGSGASYVETETFTINADTTLYAEWTAPLSFISDDFCSGTLNPAWTFVDPLTDGSMQFTGSLTENAWMEISVPGGTEHQVWTSGIQAPHIIQAATDTDFELEVKFESQVNSPQYQMQGVLVKQDDSNFLRFEIYSTNSNTYGIAASLLGGAIIHNVSIEPLNTAPIYMRVKRVGNEWTHSYSTDGINFTDIGVPFTQVLTVTGVGIYGANGVGGSSPAHTAQFDYFENLASPITNEDDCGTTYTVTYDGNGNTGGSAPVDSYDYLSGATVTVLGNTGSLVKTGSTFDGWNTADDGSGTSYVASDTFTMGSENLTLYAEWTVDSYDVTFDSQGGSAVSGQSVDFGELITEPADPTYTGYTFDGWFDAPTGGTEWNFTTDTMPASALTLYAQWKVDSYDVTFDSQGGSAVSGQSVDFGELITEPADPTYTGYTFDGWFDAPTGGTEWNFTTDTMPASALTLYAQWKVDSYDVTFDSQGGSAVSGQSVDFGELITEPADPTYTGYTFDGWFDAPTGGTEWDFENDTMPASALTLYAQWKVDSYDVTFDSQGGSAVSGQSVDFGELITEPADPTYTGYTFDGWFDAPTGGTEWDFDNDTMPASALTLYAQWKVDSYDVTFDSQGGSAVSGQSVDFGELITEPADPTYPGFSFVGWFDAPTGGTEWDFDNDTMPASALTLYAQWTALMEMFFSQGDYDGWVREISEDARKGELLIRPTSSASWVMTQRTANIAPSSTSIPPVCRTMP